MMSDRKSAQTFSLTSVSVLLSFLKYENVL